MSQRPHVVIVGAGFGGLEAAKRLKKANVDITLVDRLNHHLFQPLLYQVASAVLTPSDIAIPIRRILAYQKNVRFIMGTVIEIDKDAKKITLADKSIISFDTLIVAPGTRHSYFGNEQWEAKAPGLKTINDALRVREQILTSFEKAEKATNPKDIERLLTFIVVGGGPTGVEMAGAIAEIALKSVAKIYKAIDTTKARVFLIEGAPNILPAYPETLSKKAEKALHDLGVEVHTSCKLTDIKSDGVMIDRFGFIPSECVIWAAGNQASPLLKTLQVPLDRPGRVIVEKDLSIAGYPNIFVIGDASCYIDENKKPLPGLAPVAKQQGYYVANIIYNELNKEERTPFKYNDKGSMATIGRGKAVALVKNLQLSGLIAWLAWVAIHIVYLIGFSNRLYVLLRWMALYLSSRRNVLLITHPIDDIVLHCSDATNHI